MKRPAQYEPPLRSTDGIWERNDAEKGPAFAKPAKGISPPFAEDGIKAFKNIHAYIEGKLLAQVFRE